MKKIVLIVLMAHFAFAEVVLLEPNKDLSIADLINVANGEKVALSTQAKQNIQSGFNVLIDSVLQGKSVYGLSVGVGWNKDKPVFDVKNNQKVISDELLNLSKNFNKISLRAHSLGIGESFEPKIVRMAMLIRLHSAISGESGISPELANRYLDFLNLDITPLVPKFGSVGEADITLASHIGLAMMGEYKVWYKGKIIDSSEALRVEKLPKLEPVAKDFLSILSNNSLMNAYLLTQSLKTEKTLIHQTQIFALMLEGLNGNIAPFSELAIKARGFEYINESAKEIRACLKGSYLEKSHAQRALQDTLSFRTAVYALAEAKNSLKELNKALLIAINHSDDNPLVLIDSQKVGNEVMDSYFINEHQAIIPTANFEFLPIVSRLETLNLNLARLAENITQSLLRLSDPAFSKLPRFLTHQENKGHGFGAIEKPIVTLNEQIKNASLPQSIKSTTLAGNIEDIATFSNISAMNLELILRDLTYLQSFELMYASQAIDLRKESDKSVRLGKCSNEIYTNYRKIVPFFKQDSIYTLELQKGFDFLTP